MSATQHVATTSVRIVPTVDLETSTRFYELYRATFGPLAILAVNRHLLTEEEFMSVMVDERIDKYLICDDATDEAIAMCTLTNHLETVTWVSAEYFAHHYPDHAARNAVYYLGFSLVDSSRRRVQLFTQLIMAVSETLFEQNAMCAYDICQFNNETIGLGDAVGAMVQQVGQVDVRAVDTQTYYTAVPVQPTKSDKLRLLPGQRATL